MAQTVSRKSIVYDILFSVESGQKSAKQAEKALKDVDKGANDVTNSLKNLGKAFLGAFAVEAVIQKTVQLVGESIKLAQAAEGVKKAFARLNDPNLLNELRKATRGTVSDVMLMQAAVRAQNFKIPLQQLGTYFDFARQRARDTGQSVDFLVNSIIDGIGRKSTLVLDNLGLSASEIQAEFAKTGDLAVAVGNIIQREMGEAGDATKSAADKIDTYNVAIENLKTELGEKLLPVVGTVAEALTNLVKNLDVTLTTNLITGAYPALIKLLMNLGDEAEETAGDFDSFAQKMSASLNQVAKFTTPFDELNKKIVIFSNTINDVLAGKQDANLNVLTTQFADLKKELANTDLPVEKLRSLSSELKDIEERLRKLTELDAPLENIFAINPDKVELLEKVAELQRQINIEGAKAVEVSEANTSNIEREIQAREALASIAQSSGQIFSNLASLAAENANTQIALSIASIIASQAQALAAGVRSAAALQFPANLPAIFTTIATITGVFAQIVAIGRQAKAAQSAANAFAEGEVDIHRPGEKRGKDSIPAVIMPGETVTTTEKTARYKPFLQAIHEGTLEDLIRVNYIEPALAVKAMENAAQDSTTVDYSQRFYKQLLATSEGNSVNKKSVRVLERIEKKLGRQKPQRYV